MPSPSTTQLPIPKSWDEFEDIVADLLKVKWRDPYITRNGRSGQSQHGVDIYGQPQHLHGKYAGVQCKCSDKLDFQSVQDEVTLAKGFVPQLQEYLIAVTMSRDAGLQEQIRIVQWPFRVHIMFWEDISLELSGNDELLQKHFPGWMRKPSTEKQVFDKLMSSKPEDYTYDDIVGRYFYKHDTDLRLELDRSERTDREFNEPWTRKFPDRQAYRQEVYIYYRSTKIKRFYFVNADGSRYLIPFPKSAIELRITSFQYHLGHILNHPITGYNFDNGLRIAGIEVEEETSLS